MNQIAFLKFINLLLRNKKPLFINAMIVGVVSLTIAFLLPKWYDATTLFTPPEAEESSALGSLIGSLPMSFGFSETTNTERFVTLLYSRTLMDALIDTFNLQEEFDYEYRFLLREFIRENIVFFETFDDGSMNITVVFPDDSVRPAIMANYLFRRIDDMYKKIQSRDAHFQRVFLEQQYNKLIGELNIIEDSLALFQKKNTILEPTEQIKGSVELIANLELEKIQTEVELNLMEKQYRSNSSQIKLLRNKKRILENRISELVNPGYSESFFQSLKEVPKLNLTYYRLMRDIEIKQKIMEFLIPQLEKAKLDEVKDTPSLLVIDEAIPAEYKYKPKRALIGLISVMLAFIFHVSYLLISDFILNKRETNAEFLKEFDEIRAHIKRKK